MRYLHSRNESGAYSSPQNYPFEGAIALNDDQLATFLAFNGFGDIADGVFTGNQTLLDAWKAAQPEPEKPQPTAEEKIALLQAQIQAQSTTMDFYEDCIAEMAETVYA